MGRYFGTDGARGRANDTLTLDMAVKIGQYLGWYYGKENKRHAKILIGKDTRLSSDMFEMGLAAGATSTGAVVYLLGVCPTPSVSFLIQKEQFDCGIMVSASHNPFHDNGIKLFNGEGCKMDPAIEALIEDYIDDKSEIEIAVNEKIGHTISWDEGLELYESWLKSVVDIDLNGMNIALDLANGSATSCAAETLSALGATVEVIHSAPNGININTKCGSTHPQELQRMMKEGNYHVGFAFDGDADRLIAVDEDGNLIDGDHTMYICGCYMHEKGILHDDVVVTTVMSNLGLYHALTAKGIKYEQTAVGDKYVFECMREHGYSVGGEQSGHIIFNEHENTGDGLMTALKLLEIMVNTKKSLKELSEDLFIYPQLLINTPVKDKHKAMEDPELLKVVDEVARELGDEGRILVRPSGTEPLVRVMVEAKTDELCEQYVNQVIDFINAKGL
ncbi:MULTISPECIES: phosphoglucosamine mutase [Bacillota]|uniref:Phosphoglucosamine mutase n=2 Tax=Amedibacillus TaxID=2749846 RepID=A0A7G9GJA0_9FIRM|nr:MULTISPECIES: phosphoglucosamine mutase [Bacillota]QNM10882.1 phosphoglucosamine mutase [[Eubacterium] hominis]MCH4285315.1 phosphoglucosamine mutase [Amedibacillus hominis]RGB58376.1 phosphoglucosamine mutase [Absiella sp. AM22-9]RGB63263.1 phosphoglucosamine mutase [Absiella sp. AM10-20]RGB67093.1 phosphoglucosamine mutase [Absiella sp. AM09-45]